MEAEYNIVVDALQKKLDEIEEIQNGCDKQRRVIGGGIGLMDCIRYEQMDELRQAIKREQSISHVNETPKNEHDSDGVLNKSGNVDMMREALLAWKAADSFQSTLGRELTDADESKLFNLWSTAEELRDRAIAAKPAPLVRLTESELLKAFTTAEKRKLVWQVDRERYLRHARIVMDAMQKKNGE